MIIECELTRADVTALEALNYKDVYFVFPENNPNHKYKTRIILKKPKTDSSIRKVWIPNTLAKILREWKKSRTNIKIFLEENIRTMIWSSVLKMDVIVQKTSLCEN